MTRKMIVISFFGILIAVIAGAVVGNYLSKQTKPQTIQVAVPTKSVVSSLSPTINLTPFPTIPPLPFKVKSIDDKYIVITSTKGGDMHEPKDPSHLTVYRMKNGIKTPVTYADVKVGQNVSLTIIIPGKKAELVIEE